MSGQSGDDYTVNDHEAAGRAHDTLPLSIMTWNIWQGTLLDQIMETVTRIKPDVLALQEVIEEHGDDGRRNDAAVIAAALGREYRHIYYTAISTHRGVHAATQGNAIISRYAIMGHESRFLSPLEWHRGDAESQSRIVVMATLDVRGQPLHVLTTHLAASDGLAPSEMRRHQIDTLLPLLPDARAVLLGDFNSPPDSADVRRIGSLIPPCRPRPEREDLQQLSPPRPAPAHRLHLRHARPDRRQLRRRDRGGIGSPPGPGRARLAVLS